MKKFFLSLTMCATLVSAVGFCQDDEASFSDEVIAVEEVDARQERENKIMELQNELMALEAERANELSSNGYSKLDGSPITAPQMMSPQTFPAQPMQPYVSQQQNFVGPQNSFMMPQPNYSAPIHNYAPVEIFQPQVLTAPIVPAPMVYQQFAPQPMAAALPVPINPHPQPIPAAVYLPPTAFAPAMTPVYGAPQIMAVPAKKKGCGLFGCGR